MYEHLTLNQFLIDYTNWIWHGEDTYEAPSSTNYVIESEENLNSSSQNPMQVLINDAFARHGWQLGSDFG